MQRNKQNLQILIQDSRLPSKRKIFWIKKIPTLNAFWIIKLHEVFSADSIEKFNDLEDKEVKYQKSLIKKIEKCSIFIKKVFKIIEQKSKSKEFPDEYLNYHINTL